MTAMIDVANRNGLAVVTMNHGKANALDIEFCEALASRIRQVAASDARAVVLTANGRIFSAGVDLVRLSEGGPPYIRKFLPYLDSLLAAVFECGKPIVAAVNGHAIAGGCILACATDRRIMAQDGGGIGVTELQVGVPFPTLALEIMRHVTASHYLEEVILGAGTYAPEDAKVRGLIHEIVPADQLLASAEKAAEGLASVSPKAFALSKRQLRAPAMERLAREGKRWDAEVGDLWVADVTAQRIRAYVTRTLRKS